MPMLIKPTRDNLNKIVILNPKGGCGKSTIATNIAASYARQGSQPTIMDYDPQASTMGWLDRRPSDLPVIHGIAAYKKSMHATRSWQLRIPDDTCNLIVDSPAGMNHDDLREVTRDAASILVPVLPSTMDIHAASRCIADLLLVAKIDRRDRKLAVIANRTRKNTSSCVFSTRSAFLLLPYCVTARISYAQPNRVLVSSRCSQAACVPMSNNSRK